MTVTTTRPTVQVLISFSTGPNDAPSFVDVTADVLSFSTKRGKSGGRWSAGTCTVVLKNLNRYYEPLYTGSPYFPNVIVKKIIQIKANGFARFTGKVEKWQTAYPSKNWATTTIQASDIFKDLSRLELESPFVQEVLADLDAISDSRKMYLRMGEASGLVASDSSGAGNNAEISVEGDGQILYQQTDPVTDDSNGAFTFIPGATGHSRILLPLEVLLTGSFSSVTIAGFMKTTNANNNPGAWMCIHPATAGYTASLGTVGGKAQVYWNGTTLTSTTTVSDGQFHHIHFTGQNGTLYLIVDGVQEASSAGSIFPFSGGVRWFLGGFPRGYGNSFNGSLDEWVVAPAYIPASRARAQYLARNALINQWSDERINWIADQLGLDPSMREFGVGRTKLQSASNMAGQTGMQHAQSVLETEAGQLFVRADGSLEFISRYGPFGDRATSTTSQLSLVDNLTVPGYEYIRATFELTDEELASEVSVARRNGVTAVARDQDSATKYGSQGFRRRGAAFQNLTSESNNDKDAQDAADWYQTILKDPTRLVKGLEVFPPSNDVLELELWDRITAAVQPTPVADGSPISFPALITNISDTFNARSGEYRVTLDASASELAVEPLWIWGTTTWDSQRWGWEQQVSRSATAAKWDTTTAWGTTFEWA